MYGTFPFSKPLVSRFSVFAQDAPAKSHLHPAGGFRSLPKMPPQSHIRTLRGGFWSSPKMPPARAAGWDEELSNIDPQAVYHTAWGDFGNRKTGFPVGNAHRRVSLPQKPRFTENKRQCMGLSPLVNLLFPVFRSSPKMPPQSHICTLRGAFGLCPRCPRKVTSVPCGGAFGLRPRCPRPGRQVGMKNCRTSTRKPYTIRRGAISAIEKREIRETAKGGFYLKAPGL